jgi:hypothetical protein
MKGRDSNVIRMIRFGEDRLDNQGNTGVKYRDENSRCARLGSDVLTGAAASAIIAV